MGGDLHFHFTYSRYESCGERADFEEKSEMIREMSLDLFGELFTAFVSKPNREEKKLAAALVEDALAHADGGDEQKKYAETAKGSIRRALNAESRNELARIAVWHYEKCAASFRRAADGFESAAKLQNRAKSRRKFLQKAGEMARYAAQAELTICEIEEFRREGTR